MRRGKLTPGVLLFQDNAPAHTSQVAMTAATECGIQILPHPPYSPDMAPSDFYWFSKLKSHLRGTQYGRNEGVIEAINEYFGDQERKKDGKNQGMIQSSTTPDPGYHMGK